MPRLRNSATIQLLRTRNPHRYGTQGYRLWNCFEDGMTVGTAIERGILAGFTRNRMSGYVWFCIRRNFLTVPGVTLTQRAPRARDIVSALSPLSSDLSQFTFGAELECWVPQGMSHEGVARAVSDAGIPCTREAYGHHTMTRWKVVTDASLGSYTRGAELVSPVLRGEEGLRQIEQVCAVLTRIGCKITKKCGYHVHVGARDEDVNFFKRLLQLYSRHERVIETALPESRKHNQYCGPISTHGIDRMETRDEVLRAFGASDLHRYRKVNVHSWFRHGTVEFRQAAGTVEADKASFWTKFCLRMAAFAKSSLPLPQTDTLADLLTVIGCADDEKQFFANRVARFATLNQRAA